MVMGIIFLTLPSMKTQCTAECRDNCSCTAYAYANLQNVDKALDTTRCLVWMGELVDMEKFNNDFGENLYLRRPSSHGIYFSLCTYSFYSLVIVRDGLPIHIWTTKYISATKSCCTDTCL
jgi:hypothetical protein